MGWLIKLAEADEGLFDTREKFMAMLDKHPAIVVVGDKDIENGSVGLRLRGEEHERRGVLLTDAVSELSAAFAPPR